MHPSAPTYNVDDDLDLMYIMSEVKYNGFFCRVNWVLVHLLKINNKHQETVKLLELHASLK